LHGIYDFTAANDEKILDIGFDFNKIIKLKIA
jgi:hypothetical protein